MNTQLITTAVLGKTKMPKAFYENPDGTPISIATDITGKKRNTTQPTPGPIENPGNGTVKIKVW